VFTPTAKNKKFVNNANIGSYVEIEGSRIHYMVKGSGQPLLLIHGIGQSMYAWRCNFNELAQNYKVIALDLPGFGYSEYIDMEYYPENVAEFLKAFMDAINVKQAHVAAFSTGCIYALALAYKYTDLVDRLILISPGALPEKGVSTWSNMLLSGTFTKLALSILTRKKLKKVLYESYFDKTCLNDEIVEQYYCFMDNKEQKENIFFAMATMDAATVLQNVRELDNHVLILSGQENPWRYQDEIEEFSLPFKHAYVSITRNCGHMMHEEKDKKFNESVVEFLEWNLKVPVSEDE
jgi:pimeloyl-ACP methyl ester carboxylesterase